MGHSPFEVVSCHIKPMDLKPHPIEATPSALAQSFVKYLIVCMISRLEYIVGNEKLKIISLLQMLIASSKNSKNVIW